MTAKETGDIGETAVCRYLESHGYTVRERNFRICGGEIDIIAEKGEDLCFVEVKTRRIGSQESGDEAVTEVKMRRIIRAARQYCENYDIDETAWYIQYDIAEVSMWQGEVIEIDYLENAFDESDFSL